MTMSSGSTSTPTSIPPHSRNRTRNWYRSQVTGHGSPYGDCHRHQLWRRLLVQWIADLFFERKSNRSLIRKTRVLPISLSEMARRIRHKLPTHHEKPRRFRRVRRGVQRVARLEGGFLKFFLLLSALGWIAISVFEPATKNRSLANDPAVSLESDQELESPDQQSDDSPSSQESKSDSGND